MKKIIILGILCLVSLEAYEIKSTYWADKGSFRHKVYNIQCNNGKNIIAQYYPSSNTYHASSGKSYTTLQNVINNSCKKQRSLQKRTLNQGGIYCKKSSDIRAVLESEVDLALQRLRGASDENTCSTNAKKSTVIFIKTFNGKKDGLIDNYSKIKAGNGYYFVNTSDLN